MTKTMLGLLLAGGVAVAAEPGPTPAAAPIQGPNQAPNQAVDSFLRDFALTQKFDLGVPVQAQPTPDGKAVLFLRAEPRSPVNALYRFDVATGSTKKLLAPADLLRGAEEKLSAAERAQRERMRQTVKGFVHFELSHDGSELLTALSGRLFLVRLADGDVRELAIKAQPAFNPRLSPDGSKVAFVSERDLYVYDVKTQKERRLTHASGPGISNGMAEFVAEEELDRDDGFWWSPDSRALAFEEADTRGVERLTLPDLAHPERPSEAVAYPRAGQPNARLRVGIVPVAGGAPRWLSWDAEARPYLGKLVWQEHAPLTLVLLSRDQKSTDVVAFDGRGGPGKLLLSEHDDAFLEIDATVPSWLPDGSAFLWSSSASGAPVLELRDAGGKRLRALSSAKEGYLELEHVDGARRLAWFHGAATPVEDSFYRVSLEGGAAVAVSGSARSTGKAEFGWRGPVWVHTYRGGDFTAHAQVHVESAGGDRVVGELPSVALMPPMAIKQELLQVGALKLWAAVVRPHDFDAHKKYPVVVDVYAGPHKNQVTAAPVPMRQWIADHGVIVVAIDGRGTPRRGRAWAQAIASDFSAALDDQVSGLQALGARLPELDLLRVGITGWSFGGYESTLALLRRPDVYHVAVAGAPVVDWQDYDTTYTERYLGTPASNGDGYRRASLLTWAPKLARPLLLIHGTADDNVYFLHSLKLMDALFRAGRPAQLLPLSGFTHRVADPVAVEQLNRRLLRFLLDVLQAPQPPARLPAP